MARSTTLGAVRLREKSPRSSLEPLEARIAPASTAAANANVLSIVFNATGDTITVSDAGTQVHVVGTGLDTLIDKSAFTSVSVMDSALADKLVLDYTGGDFLAPGKGLTFQSGAATGQNDSLTIKNLAGSATWSPSSTQNRFGTVTVGTSTLSYGRMGQGLFFDTDTQVNMSTPQGVDAYTLAAGAAGHIALTGTSNTFQQAADFTGVSTISLDFGTGDTSADSLAVSALGATGLKNFSVATGAGNDAVTFSTLGLNLPVGGGTLSFDGGTGSDTIAMTADTNFDLGDSNLSVFSGGGIALVSVEVANLTGGSSANKFTVTNWTGSGSLTGGGGSDTVVATNDADFTLSDALLKRSNHGDMALSAISVATLAGGSGANQLTLSGWSGTGTFDGSGGNDTVVLTGNADSITVNGANSVTAQGIISSGIEFVDAGDGIDSLTLSGTGHNISIDGTNATTTAGIGFTHIESINAGTGPNAVTLTSAGDTFTVSGTKAGSTYGIALSGIDSVDGGAGSNTLTNQTGAAFDADTHSVGSVTFSNFDTVSTATLNLATAGSQVALAGTNAVDFNGVHYTDVTSVHGHITLLLTSSADTLTVTGTNAGSIAGVAFDGIASVDGGTSADQAILTSSDDAVTVSGTGAFSTSGINFTNFEAVDGNGGTNSVTLTGNTDTFAVTGTRAGSGYGIDFTNLDSVDGSGGNDTLTNSAGVAFEGGLVKVASVSVLNFETISTPALSLSNSADAVTVTGTNALSYNNLAFTDVTFVDALGATDSVTLGAGVDAITVDTTKAATTNGIAFTNIETIDAGGTTNSVTLTNGDDQVTVTGNGAINVAGLDISNLSSVDGGGGTNSVALTGGVDTFTLTGTRAGSVLGITFTSIDSVDGGNGSDIFDNQSADTFAAATLSAGGVTISNFEEVHTAALSLTDNDDSFSVDVENKSTFGGILYKNFTSVDGLGGTDTIGFSSQEDTITLQGQNSVSSGGITYTHIEKVFAGSNTDNHLVLTANGDNFTVTGNRAGTIAGIDFTEISTVDGAGGANTLTNTSGTTFAAATLSVDGITVSNFQTVSTPALSLTDNGDTFTITSAGTSTFAGVNYTNLTSVDGLGGTDTLSASEDVDFTITNTTLAFNGYTLTHANFETATLTGGASANTFTISGFTKGIGINGLGGDDTVVATNDIATFTLSDAKLQRTGMGDAALTSIEIVNLTGGAGVNTFVVDGFTKSATLKGLAGDDVFNILSWTSTAANSGTLDGGDDNDTFNLSHDTESQTVSALSDRVGLTGWMANGTVTGGAGTDKIFFQGNASYVLSDTSFKRMELNTHFLATKTFTTTLSGDVEEAELIGGVARNILDAGAFSGTATLEGRGSVDNIIASKGGGDLIGYRTTDLTTAQLRVAAIAKFYTFDNFFLPDGTGASDSTSDIFAANRLGNVVSFRYFHSGDTTGVTYTVPELGVTTEQTVTAAGVSPAIKVAVMLGQVSNVEGSMFNDKLSGSTRPNTLSGIGGNDILTAKGPALDYLYGGAGNDSLLGPTFFKFQNPAKLFPGFAGPGVLLIRPAGS